MTKAYSDEERVEIASKEYEEWLIKDEVRLDNNDLVGVISIVNDKSTGEQSFVITDKYCPASSSIEQRNQVKEVTVIYRGSSFELSSDAAKDWLLNDIPTGIQVINGGGAVATPQLQSSAETLKNAMELYPNAQVFV
ncbi:hypothetical protein IGJ02_001308 [Enterococcus sp. DIV0724b]|uniref:hypothetical protein n=1 Tax=Enterococcus sp. DIV0724b TaxID=2774694 RepID=UPI003D2FED50